MLFISQTFSDGAEGCLLNLFNY